ncbi:hypothetical protein AC249_AIPGENE27331 [Exaiptasia diaphana]|nr:hypothetical protein AC249_AIPGENE27331 [Exaiptasia diaphana]
MRNICLMYIVLKGLNPGAYISPTTTISTTVETKASSGGCRVCCIILGVLFGVSLIFNVIFVGFFIWRHLTENNRQSNESENIIGVGYMSTFALQEQPTSTDGQNVVQYEHVGNGREQESANTTMYHSISPHTDTYSSLSPSTKLPPKPAGITISGIYQDIPATSQQYQSLDSFNRV